MHDRRPRFSITIRDKLAPRDTHRRPNSYTWHDTTKLLSLQSTRTSTIDNTVWKNLASKLCFFFRHMEIELSKKPQQRNYQHANIWRKKIQANSIIILILFLNLKMLSLFHYLSDLDTFNIRETNRTILNWKPCILFSRDKDSILSWVFVEY